MSDMTITNEELPVNRDFKGIWIPREIWLAKDFSCMEKCLWAEIHSLYSREKGGCFATNDYLCKFFDIKERRLQEMMAHLKHKGWIVQISFDGRSRIIKAVVPPEDFKPENSAGQPGSKAHLRGAEKCTPRMQENAPLPFDIDNKGEGILNTPPIPPPKNAAKAAEKKVLPSPKPKKEDFSPEVQFVGNEIIKSLKRTKPDYLPPKNLSALYTEVDFLLRLDKRNGQKVIDLFNWALSDSFWSPNMFKPNPAKYLRDKFDQLEMKMNAKPPKNPNEIDRRLRDKNGNVVDAWKDEMFQYD